MLNGCGRTVTVYCNTVIRGLSIGAQSLWKFLRGIADGVAPLAAFREVLPGSFVDKTIYRLKHRFEIKQSKIRTLLATLCPPPHTTSNIPPAQTIFHLKKAFPKAPCPIAAFQMRFSTSFL